MRVTLLSRRIAYIVTLTCLCMPAMAQSYFSLDLAGWQASDIIVADEGGKADGTFTVTEVLRGAATPGENISLPTLADASHADLGDLPPHRNPTTVTRLTGAKVILFLTRDDAGWQPAYGEDPHLTAIWLEQEFAFGYRQVLGEHREVFYTQHNEFMVRQRITALSTLRKQVTACANMTDTTARARACIALLPVDTAIALDDIFASLIACGKDAEQAIIAALADETLESVHPRLLRALGSTGSDAAGRLLTERINQQYRFWHQAVIDLPERWWNNRHLSYSTRRDLRMRYKILSQTLETLATLGYEGCYDHVLVLRDFWQTTPQLDNQRFSTVIGLCDGILDELDLRQ